MIFKVFYQTSKIEMPIRENTKSMFVEGENEKDVRKKLAPREYNIEFIQKVDEKLLEYEQQKENFKVEKL